MSEVEKYLETIDSKQRNELEKIRKLVSEIVPDAKEGISYGIPGFKYKGKYLIGYAGFKDHMSIFPGSEPVETFSKKLVDFKTSKGTIQFTVEKPLPNSLLEEIVKKCQQVIEDK